jgi:branched-subunit amino acid transport protein
MTALVIVLAASVASWLLRIGFITVVPAERLPARVHRAFDDVAPAVLAAIVVTHVVRAGGPGELPWETLAAVLAAAVAAWHSRNLALPVVVGVAVFGLLLAAPDLRMEATAIPVGSIPQHRPADAAAHVGADEPTARADTVRWAEAAQARIIQETLAARAGVAEWSRFLAPDVTVDDRAWSGTSYQGRAAWREHLIGAYRLTLDEVHFQQVLLDPGGALVQQRQDHLAGLGGPAHVLQLREYGPDGIEHLRTVVAIRDLQRRPGAGDPDGFDRLEELARRYVRTWSGGRADDVADLYTAGAELQDGVAGLALRGRRAIGDAVADTAAGPVPALGLHEVPGSDEPAIYLDDRRPSATSSLVLVHGSGPEERCPGTVAVHLDLHDGRIARERRFHDPPSARRCLDDLPVGWWSSMAAVGPLDVPSGRMLVDGRPVVLRNSTPELDRLLAWAFGRFETAGLRLPSVGSVTFASGSGRCAGIGGTVEPAAEGAHVLLCLDRTSACVGADCAAFTFHARTTVLHELAHAWDLTWLDDPARQVFLEQVGLEVWYGPQDVPWAERGAEQAAEILMWGLLETTSPLPRLHRPSCEDLLAAYRTLAGELPSNGGCPAEHPRQPPPT